MTHTQKNNIYLLMKKLNLIMEVNGSVWKWDYSIDKPIKIK